MGKTAQAYKAVVTMEVVLLGSTKGELERSIGEMTGSFAIALSQMFKPASPSLSTETDITPLYDETDQH